MKCRFFLELLAVTTMVAVIQDAFGQELRQSVANGFTGKKTSWHGFDRFGLPCRAATQAGHLVTPTPKGRGRSWSCVVPVWSSARETTTSVRGSRPCAPGSRTALFGC